METSTYTPMISVIITAYNASSTVLATLQAFTMQTLPAHSFEVILVDDWSTDSTKQIVDSFTANCRFPLLYLYQPNKGVWIARNLGISSAKGDILAFTDADCTCDPDWLAVIDDQIRRQGKSLIGGEIYCHETIIFPWKMAPVQHIGVTANLAVDRVILPAGVEVFSSGFTGMVGDDIDLVIRLKKQWIALHFVQQMRVLHPANVLTFERFLIRSRGRGNEVGLYKRHGKEVLWAFSPMMQPRIFWRISYIFAGSIVGWVGLSLLAFWWGWETLLIVLLWCVLRFLLFGYRFLILYNPTPVHPISRKERVITLYYFALFLPLFCYHRVRGSIHFHFLML